MKPFYLAALSVVMPAFAYAAEPAFVTTGFEMPESVVLDTAQDRLIISNINGHPAEVDGNGYLSLMSPDGTVIDKHWVTGLDAPKGMAILGDELIVTDLTAIHIIDITTGDHIARLTGAGTVFLNDVAAGGDVAYISDMMTHTIWTYSDGVLSEWMQHDTLAHPNGLWVEEDALIVGSWGAGMQEDFSTDRRGDLLSVDLLSQEISVIASEVANLDGVVRVGEDFVVNDWITGEIFSVTPDGDTRKIHQSVPSLADISYGNGLIYMPLMFDGEITAIAYP